MADSSSSSASVTHGASAAPPRTAQTVTPEPGGGDGDAGGSRRSAASAHDRFDELSSDQLRSAAAHVAASVAHALGSPLNVISGRAEMIRRDPSNALNQLTRIEQQVQKIATGLRELVDYLALSEPARESAALDDVLTELKALVQSAADRQGSERPGDLEVTLTGHKAVVDRHHVLGTLSLLSRMAIRTCAAASISAQPARTLMSPRLTTSIQPQWIIFELSVPGLPPEQGWQLEQFHARPGGQFVDAYQILSASSALVRGLGGRLQLDPLPDEPASGGAAASSAGSLIRWSYRRHDTAELDLDVRNAHS